MHRALRIVPIGLLLPATPPFAEGDAYLRFTGFGWESGGPHPAALGDTLWIAGVVNLVGGDAGLPYSPGDREYTVILHALSAWGEQDVGEIAICHYSGGRLAIYADPAQDADWLAAPLVGEPPAGFANGELWLSAAVEEFRTMRSEFERSFFCRLEFDGGRASSWFRLPGSGSAGCPAPAEEYPLSGYTFAIDMGYIWSSAGGGVPGSFSQIKALYSLKPAVGSPAAAPDSASRVSDSELQQSLP